LSFLVSLLVGPFVIGSLKRLKLGQHVQQELPKEFRAKQGTPIMGGLIMLIALTIGSLAFAGRSHLVAWALFITLGNGLIGLIDDYLIVARGKSLGLKARQKLAAQIILALVLSLYAYNDPNIGSTVIVPWGNRVFDLGPLFVPFTSIIVIVGTSNGVNLTDGMDGLAAGTVGIASVAFLVMMLLGGHMDLSVFAGSLAGACLGFSWFNSHPAQVFMGDTGSLSLGAGIASLAVLTRTEFFLIPIGAIFLTQVIADSIQVSVYKLKKRRVFRMAPLHYHFHLSGMSETKIVFRFWTVGIIFGIIGIALYAMSI
jgi:phospho-N-acetylmuramoyl-pentapeptide-transferase